MGTDMMKIALVHISLGYQFYLVVISMSGYGVGGPNNESKDDAIKAFLIIGFLLYSVVFILMLLINFGELAGDKNALIATLVLTFTTVVCIIIGISIYASAVNGIPAYSFTVYCLGAIMAFIGAIFLMLPMCGVSV